MSLTFYYAPMSTASTVQWTLEELGIPFEAVKIDLSLDAEEKQKLLGPVNPNLRVPVLVHDGVAIFESAAIQIHLGETFGVERNLYPKPGPQRGEALKWIVWTNVALGDAVGRWQFNTGEGVDSKLQNAAAGKQARKDVDRLIQMLEDNLQSQNYMLGADVSIVDFHLASFMQWMQYCGVDLRAFPKVAAWFDRCASRPAQARLLAS